MEGTIKSYDRMKGFGYIIDPNGNDVFMHITGVISGTPKAIEVGDKVQFVKAKGLHGFQAAKIELAR
ncbi:cold shock domain-containing protein [Fructilactobacillus vespulae]|uniref:cold-shock protein n=1 Tax=Fructilactobacillus vespulae TaxID=1249630 RepID=UPI0039B5274F